MANKESRELTVQHAQDGALTETAMEELSFDQLVTRLQKIEKAIGTVLKPGVDIGIIPGTDKPTLLKPGAEKLAMLFLFAAEYQDTEKEVGDHLTVKTVCRLIHIPTQRFVGQGVGLCTTKETRYAYRWARPKCPSCNKETLVRTKARGNYPANFWCAPRGGGCNSNFKLDDERVTGQEIGQVANDKLPDQWNTVLKMSHKRAKVDAVLGATGASQFLTQDVEDMDHGDAHEDADIGDGNAPVSDGAKKTATTPPKGAKAGNKATSASGDAKISAEQIAEMEAICAELGADPDDVVGSYAAVDPKVKTKEDLTVGMFNNFKQKAAARRKAS